MFRSVAVVGGPRVEFAVEMAEEDPLAVDTNPRSPPRPSAVKPNARQNAIPLVLRVRRVAKILPPIIQSVAVNVVDHQMIGGTRDEPRHVDRVPLAVGTQMVSHRVECPALLVLHSPPTMCAHQRCVLSIDDRHHTPREMDLDSRPHYSLS